MKSICLATLALLALPTVPAAAVSNTNANRGDVSYADAMDCSAVFSLLSTTSGARFAAEHEEMAARWLVIAMRRDGSGDGSRADAELIPLIEELIDTLNDVPSAGRREAFMDDMVNFCDAEAERIADEFNAIKL